MKDIFDFLKEFMPLWLAVLTIGFGYLIFLFAKLTKGYNQLSEKQTEYLQQRLESVDKTTGIFERTVQHQQKDLERVYKINEELKKELEKKKEIELSTLDQQLSDIQNNVEALQKNNISKADLEKLKEDITKTKITTSKRYDEYIRILEPKNSLVNDVTDVKNAYISMPFNEESKNRFKIIKSVLEEYKIKANLVEDYFHPIEIIADDIKRAIELSDIIIVDITSASFDSMYQLGYAHAKNKPVILITMKYSELSIDTSNYKVIIVDNSEKSNELLKEYLEEALTSIKRDEVKNKILNIAENVISSIPFIGSANNIMKIISKY